MPSVLPNATKQTALVKKSESLQKQYMLEKKARDLGHRYCIRDLQKQGIRWTRSLGLLCFFEKGLFLGVTAIIGYLYSETTGLVLIPGSVF